MPAKDIEKRVKSIIIAQLDVPEELLKPETHINRDLGSDSLDDVELIMALEEEFSEMGEIPEIDAEDLRTVQGIIDYITQNT